MFTACLSKSGYGYPSLQVSRRTADFTKNATNWSEMQHSLLLAHICTSLLLLFLKLTDDPIGGKGVILIKGKVGWYTTRQGQLYGAHQNYLFPLSLEAAWGRGHQGAIAL